MQFNCTCPPLDLLYKAKQVQIVSHVHVLYMTHSRCIHVHADEEVGKKLKSNYLFVVVSTTNRSKKFLARYLKLTFKLASKELLATILSFMKDKCLCCLPFEITFCMHMGHLRVIPKITEKKASGNFKI